MSSQFENANFFSSNRAAPARHLLHRHALPAALAALFMLSGGCGEGPGPTPATGGVTFKIEELDPSENAAYAIRLWRASYEAGGKTAKFGIELKLDKPKGAVPIAFGKGEIHHEADSDSSVLLQDLATAMSAGKWTAPSTHSNTLAFTTAVLGVGMSRGQGKDVAAGGFTSNPKGDWIVVKVFVPDGDKEGEFYLNLNSKKGRGEFCVKDPSYGTTVLHQLALVL